MFNCLEYSKNYFKKSCSLCWYFRDETANLITNLYSCKFTTNTTGSTPNNASSKNAKIVLPTKNILVIFGEFVD